MKYNTFIVPKFNINKVLYLLQICQPPKKVPQCEKTFKNFKKTKIFFVMVCALLEKNFQT